MAPAPPPTQCDLSSGRLRTYLTPTLALGLARTPEPPASQLSAGYFALAPDPWSSGFTLAGSGSIFQCSVGWLKYEAPNTVW